MSLSLWQRTKIYRSFAQKPIQVFVSNLYLQIYSPLATNFTYRYPQSRLRYCSFLVSLTKSSKEEQKIDKQIIIGRKNRFRPDKWGICMPISCLHSDALPYHPWEWVRWGMAHCEKYFLCCTKSLKIAIFFPLINSTLLASISTNFLKTTISLLNVLIADNLFWVERKDCLYLITLKKKFSDQNIRYWDRCTSKMSRNWCYNSIPYY